MVCDHAPDPRCLAPERMGPQGRKRRCRPRLRHHRHELSLIGNLKGIEAEDLAGRSDHRIDRHRPLVELDAESPPGHQLAKRHRQAAAGWVAKKDHVGRGGEEIGDKPMERSRVALNRRLKAEPLADAHHRHPMIADGAADEDHIPRHRRPAPQA